MPALFANTEKDSQVIEQLVRENEESKRTIFELKTLHSQLQQNYDDLFHQLERENLLFENYKRDQELVQQEWSDQLNEKIMEIHKLKSLPRPNEEALRYQYFLEFEKTIAGRKEQWEEDAERWKTACYQIEKEFERFKVQIKDKDLEYQSTLEDLAILHQTQIDAQKRKYTELENKYLPLQDLEEKYQRVSREHQESLMKNKSLLEENEELREELSNQSKKYQMEIRQLTRQNQEQQSSHKTLTAEKQQLKTQLFKMEEELHQLKKSNEELMTESGHLRQEAKKQEQLREEAEHKYSLALNDLKFENMKQKTDLEKEMEEKYQSLERLYTEKENENKKLLELIEELKEDLNHKEKKFQQELQYLTNQNQSKDTNYQILNAEIEQLKLELDKYEKEISLLKRINDEKTMESQHLKSEVSKFEQLRQNSLLEHKSQNLESKNEKSKLESNIQQLEKQIETQLMKIQELKHQNEEMNEKFERVLKEEKLKWSQLGQLRMKEMQKRYDTFLSVLKKEGIVEHGNSTLSSVSSTS